MVLSKYDIISACNSFSGKPLINPCIHDNIQACSYDLTFSGEYYFYQPEDKDKVLVKNLTKNQKLRIPADAICYVLTTEEVNMPNNLTASISLSFGLIKKGVMLSVQPPYDPGYSGKTVALLHNLSDKAVEITVGDHILNMVFEKLNSAVGEADLYRGKYQGLSSLSSYCTEVKCGGVFSLMQEFEHQKKKFENSIPNIMMLITVVIGVVAILVSIMATKNLFSPNENSTKSDVSYLGNEIRIAIPSDSMIKEITISANGDYYLINFDDATIHKLESDSQGKGNGN